MRVATYNIQHGAAGLTKVLDTCASLDVEVLAVHEVDRRLRRSGGTDQPAAIAGSCQAHVSWGPALRIGWRGSYGNALVTRHEPGDVAVVGLPRVGTTEPRVAILAAVQTSLGPVSVAATHLGTRQEENGPQLAEVVRRLLARPAPQLLLGDLNRHPDQLDLLADAGFQLAGGPPTFPAEAPRHRIDHVAVRGLGIAAVEVPASSASDHRPLVVELS